MSAYLVAHFAVKDPAKMATYSQAAGPIIASFGGELLIKIPAASGRGIHCAKT